MGSVLEPISGPQVAALLVLALSGLVLVALLIVGRQRDLYGTVRLLPAFQNLQEQIASAAESGGTVHIALGNGGLNTEHAVTSLAGLQVVEALADASISSNLRPIITVGDPTLLFLAQDIVRRAGERYGLAEQHSPDRVRFVAPSPVAYAAGAADVVAAEGVAASVMAGAFGAEISLITDAGARRDLPQMAAAAAPRAIGALYPATDRLAVGEELYAAGAQMTGERRYLVSLLAQDILRVIVVLAILVTAVSAFAGG